MLNYILILTSLVSFIAVNLVYYHLLIIAKEKALVDNPDARKLQKEPIPVLGGIAVYFGILSGVLAICFFQERVENPWSFLALIASTGIMLYLGAVDDMIGIRARWRLIIEFIVIGALIYGCNACADSFHGLWGIYDFSWYIAVPLTIFACVGIINSINMIDGVNGLSSGLCILFCGVFGYVFYKTSDPVNASLAFSSAAALLPFFINNVFGLKSRMFIGDAGTMVLGMLMSWFVISILRSNSIISNGIEATGMSNVALVLSILCVPVADTIRVMFSRIFHGKSPLLPDKTHLHHIFISLGFSHFFVAIIEILIAILVMVSFYISFRCEASAEVQLSVVVVSGIIFVWGAYFFTAWQIRKQTAFIKKVQELSVHTHLGQKSWWKSISAWLDKPEEALNADRRKTDVKYE